METIESPFTNSRELKLPPLERMDTKELEIIKNNNMWKSCLCDGGTDSRLIRFLCQYLILLMVFSFCLTMLYNSKTCEDNQAFMSLLTLLLGIVVPSPH